MFEVQKIKRIKVRQLKVKQLKVKQLKVKQLKVRQLKVKQLKVKQFLKDAARCFAGDFKEEVPQWVKCGGKQLRQYWR